MALVGLGDNAANFRVYIDKRPPCFDFAQLAGVRPAGAGELFQIGQLCGNGWRKVFNVYAKLVYALAPPGLVDTNLLPNWQSWRDHCLLRAGSNTLLTFTPWQPGNQQLAGQNAVHLIMGRTYAKQIELPATLQWLNDEFAICAQSRLVVCPYFDYRQLSNQKIVYLIQLLKKHWY